MSTPNPGDVLPLWDPEIPGEVIQSGRLGIRIRPDTPAAVKVAALQALGGAEYLRQILEEAKDIDGTYQVKKPERPLEFIGQVGDTLITGKLGRTPRGLALEITDFQQLDKPYEMEKSRLRLRWQELQLVQEWDSELEGFTAIQLREEGKSQPILDSTLRFIEHLGQDCRGVPVETARDMGIPVAAVPLSNYLAVAEHAWALILNSLKRLPDQRRIMGAMTIQADDRIYFFELERVDEPRALLG